MKLKRGIAIALSLVLAASALTACGGSTSSGTSSSAAAQSSSAAASDVAFDAEENTIRFATQPGQIRTAINILADQLGYYKEEGVNVEFVNGSGTEALTAITTGKSVGYRRAGHRHRAGSDFHCQWLRPGGL